MFLTRSLVAQTSCEDLKKENDYLKKALSITTPIKAASGPKVDFNLLKCEGDSKQQKLTMVFTIVNHDANKHFFFDKANVVDIEGNQYTINSATVSSKNIPYTVYTDTPVKTTIDFSQVLPSVKMLKLVSVDYGLGDQVNLALEFKDIPVTWK